MMVNRKPSLILSMGLIRDAKFDFIFLDQLVGMQNNIGTCVYITELWADENGLIKA